MKKLGCWWSGGVVASLALAGWLAGESEVQAQTLRPTSSPQTNSQQPSSSGSTSTPTTKKSSFTPFPGNQGSVPTFQGSVPTFTGRDPNRVFGSSAVTGIATNPYTGSPYFVFGNTNQNALSSLNLYQSPLSSPFVSPYSNPYTSLYPNQYMPYGAPYPTTPFSLYPQSYVNPYNPYGGIYSNPYNAPYNPYAPYSLSPYNNPYGVNIYQNVVNPYQGGGNWNPFVPYNNPLGAPFGGDALGGWGGSVGPAMGYRPLGFGN